MNSVCEFSIATILQLPKSFDNEQNCSTHYKHLLSCDLKKHSCTLFVLFCWQLIRRFLLEFSVEKNIRCKLWLLREVYFHKLWNLKGWKCNILFSNSAFRNTINDQNWTVHIVFNLIRCQIKFIQVDNIILS